MPVQQRQLSNGLQVRIITDPQARCASALVQVGVGSLHEPDAWPGLAHLLEHVLFAGSAGFQDDERLMMWAQAQGGRLNATTLGNGTAFFFECSPALLADGLARLTDMLVAPLLAESAIRQETAAIDAEYRLLCGHQDTLADAALSAAFAAHPWQQFHVGDELHFGTDTAALREALRRFHQQAYYAANTTLWLQGPQPADELWQLAERAGLCFADEPQVIISPLPPVKPSPAALLLPATSSEPVQTASSSAATSSEPVQTASPSAALSSQPLKTASPPMSQSQTLPSTAALPVQLLKTNIPPLELSAQRDYMLQRPDGERLRLSFLLNGHFGEELTLLRQLLRDEAEGSLMAALRGGGLCDELRVLRPYISAQQQVLSIELTLVAPKHAAMAEGLLHHWLQRLAGLNEIQLQHYAALAVREFNPLPVMDQLRERAFGFAPPEGGPLRWQPLLSQLIPLNMTRLHSSEQGTGQPHLSGEQGMKQHFSVEREICHRQPGGEQQPEPRYSGGEGEMNQVHVQGFALALTAQRLDKVELPSVMPLQSFFPQPLPQPQGATAIDSPTVSLPHDHPDEQQAVLLLSPATDLPLPWGQIMQAGLRTLMGNCAHGGGELRLECHQGLWLIQLHGSPELMRYTVDTLMVQLTALPAEAVEQGERAYQRQQRAQFSDIAVRALIAALPQRWLNSTYSLNLPPPSSRAWQAHLSGGSHDLHRYLAHRLSRFPGMINPLARMRPLLPVPLPEYSVATDGQDAAVVLFCPLTVMTAEASAALRCLALIYQPAFFQQLRVERQIGYVVSCRAFSLAGHPGVLFCLQSPTLSHRELWGSIDDFLQRMTVVLASLTAEQLAGHRQILLDSLSRRTDDPMIASRERWLQWQEPAPPMTLQAIAQIDRSKLLLQHSRLSQQRQHWWRVSNRPSPRYNLRRDFKTYPC